MPGLAIILIVTELLERRDEKIFLGFLDVAKAYIYTYIRMTRCGGMGCGTNLESWGCGGRY